MVRQVVGLPAEIHEHAAASLATTLLNGADGDVVSRPC
jgi:hypothetical protein